MVGYVEKLDRNNNPVKLFENSDMHLDMSKDRKYRLKQNAYKVISRKNKSKVTIETNKLYHQNNYGHNRLEMLCNDMLFTISRAFIKDFSS